MPLPTADAVRAGNHPLKNLLATLPVGCAQRLYGRCKWQQRKLIKQQKPYLLCAGIGVIVKQGFYGAIVHSHLLV